MEEGLYEGLVPRLFESFLHGRPKKDSARAATWGAFEHLEAANSICCGHVAMAMWSHNLDRLNAINGS